MSLYEFQDLSNSEVDKPLPSEAVYFNDICLDREIEGFTTLYTKGRESLENEINFQNLPVDGSIYRDKRVISRTITVTFKLEANSASEFQTRYKKLAKILNTNPGIYKFHDEPDVYYNGVLNKIDNPESNCLSTIQSFEIFCPDPYKYSTTLKEFTSDDSGVIKIENNGLPCEIDYEVKCSTENGFIAFVSEQGAIELGNIQDLDGENYTTSDQVLSQSDFYNAKDSGGYDYLHPNYTLVGGTIGKLSSGTDRPRDSDGSTSPVEWLELKNGGSGSGWHGGGRTVTLKTDSTGHVGAKDFDCYFYHWFQMARAGEYGEQTITWLTSDNKVILGVNIYASHLRSTDATIEWWTGDRTFQTFNFQAVTYPGGNVFGSGSNGHDMLRKEGDKITYFYWGKYYNAIIPEIKDLECAKVQICFKRYGTSTYLTRNYIKDFSMKSLGVTGYRDVTNRFPAESIIKIKDGMPYRDGMPIPSEEVLGSVYFKAPSGDSEVHVSVSEWAGSFTAKATIRERWL